MASSFPRDDDERMVTLFPHDCCITRLCIYIPNFQINPPCDLNEMQNIVFLFFDKLFPFIINNDINPSKMSKGRRGGGEEEAEED